MPSIDIQVLDGVFTDAEKAQILTRITEAFGSVAGQTIAAGTSVRIHEIRSGSWCYAGQVLTTDMAREMKARG
ncbi:tautomerase family protein [Cognatishimia sp. F0-27]|uniref:tautomerase family protein n=1 Tax=Cognatishimia sp. F0-27 TaxID=2816855 RepID=UPI001D0C39F0|nr:tautomerase family protein [Cognatishimia sp. F0-27]MCC1492326.1 tautomerase family protein [Cognatishimia sp. F0-27]